MCCPILCGASWLVYNATTYFIVSTESAFKFTELGLFNFFIECRGQKFYRMEHHKRKKMGMRRLVPTRTKSCCHGSSLIHLLQVFMIFMHMVLMDLFLFEKRINVVFIFPLVASIVLVYIQFKHTATLIGM